MRRSRRSALLAVGLAVTMSGAVCAPALAADPVLALTTGGQLTRFDADVPGAVPPAITPGGLEPGDTLIAIGTEDSIIQGLGSSGQVYAIDLETYSAVPVAGGLTPAQLTTGVGLGSGPYFPQNVVLADGSVCAEWDDGNCYPPDGSPAAGADLLAAAVASTTGPVGPSPAERPLYLIDGTADALLTVNQPPFGSTMQTVGALGVPVAVPTAFAVSSDGARGFLVTGQPGQTEYSVDLSSGAATPIGQLGPSAAIRSLAAIPPPAIGQTDPVTGTYDAATGAAAGGVLAFPNPAVEGRDKAITVPVNRSGDPSVPAVAAYRTIESGMPGAAVPGVDYVPVSGTLHFAAGQQYSSFSIPLLPGPAVPATPWGVDISISIGDTGASGSIELTQPGYALPPVPAKALLGGLSATQTIATVLAHGIGVPVTCAQQCTVRLSATATTKSLTTGRSSGSAGTRAAIARSAAVTGRAAVTTLAARTIRLTRPGRYLVHLRLSGSGRRSLRTARRAAVSVLGTASFASGARVSDHAGLTLVGDQSIHRRA
jgi:hypothetical protein